MPARSNKHVEVLYAQTQMLRTLPCLKQSQIITTKLWFSPLA